MHVLSEELAAASAYEPPNKGPLVRNLGNKSSRRPERYPHGRRRGSSSISGDVMGSTRAEVGQAEAGLRARGSKHPPADGTRLGTGEGQGLGLPMQAGTGSQLHRYEGQHLHVKTFGGCICLCKIRSKQTKQRGLDRVGAWANSCMQRAVCGKQGQQHWQFFTCENP